MRRSASSTTSTARRTAAADFRNAMKEISLIISVARIWAVSFGNYYDIKRPAQSLPVDAEDLADDALGPVSQDRVSNLLRCNEAKPGVVCLRRGDVEHEEAGQYPSSPLLDRRVVPRREDAEVPGETVPTLDHHHFDGIVTASFLRPLARRRRRISRPALVAVRARKPCTLFLRVLCGWYVLFTTVQPPSGSSHSKRLNSAQNRADVNEIMGQTIVHRLLLPNSVSWGSS